MFPQLPVVGKNRRDKIFERTEEDIVVREAIDKMLTPKEVADKTADAIVTGLESMLNNMPIGREDVLPDDVNEQIITLSTSLHNLSKDIRKMGESLPDPLRDVVDELDRQR